MFCRKCGNEMPDDSLFCNKCGAKVEIIDNQNDNTCNESVNENTYGNECNEEIISEKNTNANSVANNSTEDLSNDETTVNSQLQSNKKPTSIIAILVTLAVVIIIIIMSINAATTCSLDNCSRTRDNNSEYCDEHTCNYSNCTRLAFDGYCYSHTCSYTLCDNIICDDSEYCYSHKCNRDGCKNQKAINSDYCSSHQVNMRTRLDVKSFWFKLNSAGGIKLYFEAKNNSGKEIKYINFPVYLYNAVGDSIESDFGDRNISVEIVGPVKAGATAKIDGDIIGYCDLADRIDIKNVTITYMDGTRESGNLGYYAD